METLHMWDNLWFIPKNQTVPRQLNDGGSELIYTNTKVINETSNFLL